MSSTETAAAPVEEVKAVETPAPAPEAAPAAEAPAAVSFPFLVWLCLCSF